MKNHKLLIGFRPRQGGKALLKTGFTLSPVFSSFPVSSDQNEKDESTMLSNISFLNMFKIAFSNNPSAKKINFQKNAGTPFSI